jgi:amino acid transporter
MASPSTPGLLRSLRRWDLVAVVLNGVIGAGIFGLPSKVFALAGNFSLLAFGACGLCVWLIVLSFAEVGARFTGTGGPYLFARATYGGTVGFGIGWLVWVARITSFAANLALLPEYLGFFLPAVATGTPRAAILIGVIALLAFLNVRGVRSAADVSNVFAAGKLVPLAVFIGAGLFYLAPAPFSLAGTPNYRGFSQSVMLLVYAFTGFEMAVIPAGEIRSPIRDVPAALMIGMALVVTFYVLIQAVCMGTLPELAASHRPLADAAARFLGMGGAAMITGGIVISLAGNLNALILAASRVLFAMAEHGDLPTALAAIHPRFRTPTTAVILTAAIMLSMAISGTFVYLVTLSTVVRLVTYFATCGALPILRRREKTPSAAYRVPCGTAVAVAGMLVCAWLVSNCTLREARDAALAAAVGLVIHWVHRKMKIAWLDTK